MADESPDARLPAGVVTDGRLDSWKEIAAYLKRDVTTAQRWEKREAMPVHRHVHDKLGSVHAYRAELDAWSRTRNLRPNDEPPPAPAQAATLESEDAAPPLSPSTTSTIGRTQRRLRWVWLLLAGAALLGLVAMWRLQRTDFFWRNPLADAHFQTLTDFDGTAQAAAVSRDGRFVAFLSDHDRRMDLWVTQVGTGQFYNLTHGRVQELVNPAVRTVGFSPDGSLVTFWVRHTGQPNEISIWAVPTLGGQPRPYLEGVAEFDWSADGSRLAFHTPGPGDPLFVRDAGQPTPTEPIFAAAAGLHGHFPLWSPDGTFIYFVQGTLPDGMDIWRITPPRRTAEQITHHDSHVSYPVLLNDKTLVYLATEKDGSGPSLYSLDVARRVPHRIGVGVDRYTSLALAGDGRRLVVTRASAKGTLWRIRLDDTAVSASAAMPVSLTTGSGFSPRLGPDYLLYVSSKGSSDGLWKLADGAATELWSAPESRILGGPGIAPDGRRIVFSVARGGKALLYVMDADGTNARVVTDSIDLRGAPTWTPDGRAITSGGSVDGTPRVFRISLSGAAVPLVDDYSVDPEWSPRGDFLLYSGADVGTEFPVKAVTASGRPYTIPPLSLTRGSRRIRFVDSGRAIVVMRGGIQHKDLWRIDLETGAERRLTNLPPDFNIRDFDVSADGRDLVLDRVQEHSDIVLIDLARQR